MNESRETEKHFLYKLFVLSMMSLAWTISPRAQVSPHLNSSTHTTASSAPNVVQEKSPQRLELFIPKDTHQQKTIVFKVPQNTMISLEVKSEGAGELHLHAYRLNWPLKANETQTFQFLAKASGKFNFEWHPEIPKNNNPSAPTPPHAHAPAIASLEVQPL